MKKNRIVIVVITMSNCEKGFAGIVWNNPNEIFRPVETLPDGTTSQMARIKFSDKVVLSVVRHRHSHGAAQGLYEIAFVNGMDGSVVRHSKWNGDDVLGYLSEKDVDNIMRMILTRRYDLDSAIYVVSIYKSKVKPDHFAKWKSARAECPNCKKEFAYEMEECERLDWPNRVQVSVLCEGGTRVFSITKKKYFHCCSRECADAVYEKFEL